MNSQPISEDRMLLSTEARFLVEDCGYSLEELREDVALLGHHTGRHVVMCCLAQLPRIRLLRDGFSSGRASQAPLLRDVVQQRKIGQ